MAKHSIIIGILSIFLIASVAFSQSDVHYSIGLRYQMASWDTDMQYYASLDDLLNDVLTDFDSEMGHLYGPTASISYQKFGFSVTYLMGSWEFPSYPYWYSDYFGNFEEDEVTETFKRSDLIITVSYRVLPRLSVFVGFKNLKLTTEYKFAYNTDWNEEVDATGSGPGGGIAGSMPFSPTLHGYATIGYMDIGGDFETENLIGEGGLRMYFGSSPIFASLGYRYESFDGGDTILHGPILTAAFYK